MQPIVYLFFLITMKKLSFFSTKNRQFMLIFYI